MIGWDVSIKKRINYLRCIEGKGGLIDICVLHKIPHYLILYYKISFKERYIIELLCVFS